jgi:hypothetical protein
MGLKITFVFAMRHYAGNDLKREPSLQRACDGRPARLKNTACCYWFLWAAQVPDQSAKPEFNAVSIKHGPEPIGGRLVDSALAGDWGFHGPSAYR